MAKRTGSRTVRRNGIKSKAIPGSAGKNGKLQMYKLGKRSIYRHRAMLKKQHEAKGATA